MWRPEKKVRRGTEYDDMLILLTTIVMLAARWISFSRYVDSKFEIFFYPVVRPLSCSIDTSRRRQHVCVYQMYLSARSTSKYCDHLRFFVKLCSIKEIISQSALEKPEEQALGGRGNDSRYQSPWWHETSAKTFLPRIVTWKFLRTIGASKYSNSVYTIILNRSHQSSKIFWSVNRSWF